MLALLRRARCLHKAPEPAFLQPPVDFLRDVYVFDDVCGIWECGIGPRRGTLVDGWGYGGVGGFLDGRTWFRALDAEALGSFDL